MTLGMWRVKPEQQEAFISAWKRLGETFSVRLAGFGHLVHFTRPADIREIFRGEPHVLHAGEGNRLLATLVGDTSVLVLDEAPHARQRKVLLPPLKGERMRTFFEAMQSETLAVAVIGFVGKGNAWLRPAERWF